MESKLIFLDIDGTILIPGQGIRESVKEGLQRARANGHKIFICTGRAHNMLPEELRNMELDGVISSAGSDIWIYGQNVYRRALSKELIWKACAVVEEMDGICLLEGYDGVYASKNGIRLLLDGDEAVVDNPELARWRKFFLKTIDVKSMSEWDQEHSLIPKVTFMVYSQEAADFVKERLENDFYVAFFQKESGLIYNGELISKTDNKGTAIRRTAEYLKENFENTVAFGDSMNDYQMIEQAACGIVMENGDKKLKTIADRVCESVEEDGVIRELKRMGVI